ncbi:MAG TPA: hypothetical protein VK929_08635 [Longimicrobiales bacterium]|nr:hypothetical protein [Longimicrobiales bacterium]
MHPPRVALIALVTVILCAVTTFPAEAQDVRYETVNRVEFPGAAGTFMRVAARLGGSSTETVETTWISGQRMRTDDDHSSTILDLESGRVTFLDHRAKTYLEIPLDAGVEAVREATERAAADGRRPDGRDADADVRIDFRLSVDRANQRQQIAGHDAERHFITMQALVEATGADVPPGEQSGTLVVLTDIWTSQNNPVTAAMRGFAETAAIRDQAQAASTLMEVLTEAFAEDPRFRAGFQRAADESRQLDGFALRTTTRFVAVAADAEFDRALALGEGQSQGVAGAAQQAGRAALGRLARRATGAPEPAAAAADEPTQGTFVTIVSEVRNISTAAVDPAVFQVPADYRRVEGW